MSKFLIECPKCHRYNEASSGLFARHNIPCACGYVINVRNDKIVTRVCPGCGNTVAYDQSEGTKAKCPVCAGQLVADSDIRQLTSFPCQTCGCLLQVSKSAVTMRCPLCGAENNVQEAVKKAQIREKGEPATIEFRGDRKTLIWHHPMTEFVYGSQLVVRESQEAIFLRNGEALDSFGPGRHSLETPVLPKLQEKLGAAMSDLPFRAEVYFANMTTQFDLKWGTPTQVMVMDPDTGIRIPIGASGGFSFRITNPRKLLSRVVGTQENLKLEHLFDLTGGEFRSLVLGKITARLSQAIQDLNICVLDISRYLKDISEIIKDAVNCDLDEYGVELPDFTIINIVYPETDKAFQDLKDYYNSKGLDLRKIQAQTAIEREKIKLAQALAEQKAVEQTTMARAQGEAIREIGSAEAAVMRDKGYTYRDETARQVSTAAASNPGSASGDMTSEIVKMTIGMESARQAADLTRSIMNGGNETPAPAAPAASGWNCSCGRKNIDSNYCPNCGQKKPADDPQTWDCPKCGNRNLTTRFCPNCGTRCPGQDTSWDCSCGNKGITTDFCPNCGKRRS